MSVGRTYEFQIRAVAESGLASDWVGATITPTENVAPAAPTNVKFGAYNASTKSATLTWTDNATNEKAYEVRYRVDGGSWAKMADLAANTTSRNCGGLSVGRTYEFQIRAVAESGLASDWIGATINVVAPAAPTNVKFGAYNASTKSATLTWTDNAVDEVRYEVRYRVDGGFWTNMPNLAANVTSRNCGGLSVGRTYEFQIRAVAESGLASNWIGATITPSASASAAAILETSAKSALASEIFASPFDEFDFFEEEWNF